MTPEELAAQYRSLEQTVSQATETLTGICQELGMDYTTDKESILNQIRTLKAPTAQLVQVAEDERGKLLSTIESDLSAFGASLRDKVHSLFVPPPPTEPVQPETSETPAEADVAPEGQATA